MQRKTAGQKIVKIYNAENIINTQFLKDRLNDAGMEAIVKDSGYEMASHYTPEFGTYGVDIFVAEDEEQKALEIIGSCIG